MRPSIAFPFASLLFLTACSSGYDIALVGGRVMDPESGLDAVRNVAIRDGRIAAVTEEPITGGRTIDASGLVVTPGFIDLHQHGHSEESYEAKVMDGVTSAFELEVGTGDVAGWYEALGPRQLINYGVSIGHIPVRMIVMGDDGDFLPSGPGGSATASEDEVAEMVRRIEEGLAQGAVAVGFGTAYTPAATMDEIETMFRVAAEHGAPVHVHMRGGVPGLRETIAAAANAGASLHIVHANSSGGEDIAEFLAVIAEAQDAGRDVTTEAYPYGAGATRIESALFDDWETYSDSDFGEFQWVATGERLTRETFGPYRAQGGRVIIHSRTEEMTRAAIASPLTMIASDGGIRDGQGHPRSAGTYAKVLGRYVREEGLVSLMDALRRMSLEPARRLEAYVPAMANKGRLREGADADITMFDPETIIDRATYTDGTIPSAGVAYVLVNGELVVDEGAVVEGARPGRPVRK